MAPITRDFVRFCPQVRCVKRAQNPVWILPLAAAVLWVPSTEVVAQPLPVFEVNHFEATERVRVSVRNGSSVTGLLTRVQDQQISLLVEGSRIVEVRFDEMERLERSEGTRRWGLGGLLTMVGVGALGGAGIAAVTWEECTREGFMACAFDPSSRGEAAKWGAYAGGILFGVPVGILAALSSRDVWADVDLAGTRGRGVAWNVGVAPGGGAGLSLSVPVGGVPR
jgi:hypothetical protein